MKTPVPRLMLCPRDPLDRGSHDVGRADARRALDGARSFLQTGVDAPTFTGQGQQLLSRTALYTLTSLTGGVCQLPLEPRGLARKPSLVGVLSGGLRLADMVMPR